MHRGWEEPNFVGRAGASTSKQSPVPGATAAEAGAEAEVEGAGEQPEGVA